ncbi:MAG: hypothetical protein KC910_27815, partial [Candidatus Eremiobacteraeota bacterium]|nr:hypothetical protein [Candidatus Eremiobacteraeota bacterium]
GTGTEDAPAYVPGNLQRILSRMWACDDDKLAQAALLRDALGFLTRLFASIGACACQEFELLDEELEQLWSTTATVGDCRSLLEQSLQRLRPEMKHDLVRQLMAVFFEVDGDTFTPREFTSHLGFGPNKSVAQVVDFCTGLAGAYDEHLPILETWLEAARPTLIECDYHYEAGAQFGQRELVVGYRQYRLRTRMAVRLREARADVAGVSALGAIPLGAPIRPEETSTSGLTALVSELARVEPSSVAKVTPIPMPTLGYKVDYTGFAKDREGRLGHAGKLILFCAGDGVLEGKVTSTNPNLRILPAFFKGEEVRCSFWLDPDEMPQPEGYIEIETANETRKIPIVALLPRSRISDFGRLSLAGMLLAPGVVGFLYLFWVFYSTIRHVQAVLEQFMAFEYRQILRGVPDVALRHTGVGIIDLDVQPKAESAALLFLLFAVLCPLVVTKLFRYYPRNLQRDLGWLYSIGLIFPVLAFLAVWDLPALNHPMLAHHELLFLNYRTHFPYFAAFNLFASAYLFLSVGGRIDAWLGKGPLRVLLPTVLFLGYLAAVFGLVYGRSWLSIW